MTFAEVELACKGYETRMARIKEIPRLIAAVLINVNRDPRTSPVNIEDVFPLFTDKQTGVFQMSKTDYEKTVKDFGYKLPTEEDKKRLLKRHGKKV